jgi:hypothetical protein
VRAYSKGQKNDFRDAEAIAEAVQRPTMKFVATGGCGLSHDCSCRSRLDCHAIVCSLPSEKLSHACGSTRDLRLTPTPVFKCGRKMIVQLNTH